MQQYPRRTETPRVKEGCLGRPSDDDDRFLRVVAALWGTTAFGIFHQMLAYMIMVGFSERDWDEPPGTGYLTVAAIAISAILLVILTLRIPRTARDNDAQPDHDSGSLTLT